MATNAIGKYKVDDRVLIQAPDSSLASKHNGQVGRVTGFVEDYLVRVDVNGQALRFRPEDLRPYFKK